MIWHYALLVFLSLIGLSHTAWLWQLQMEHRYEPLVTPAVTDDPVTLDSDYRGLT